MAEEETNFSSWNRTKTKMDDSYTMRQTDNLSDSSNDLKRRIFNKDEQSNVKDTTNSTLNMREYAQQLAPWVYNYRLCTAMSNLPPPLPMMSCIPFGGQQMLPTGGFPFTMPFSTTSTDPQFTQVHAQLNQGNTNSTTQGQTTQMIGTEYVIPPLWRRVVAELIDFIVLFYLKIIIMIIVMRQMGILKTENVLNVHIDVVPYFDLKNMEMDIDKAFAMTSEIIALEIVNRIMITLFETCCIRKGIGTHGGATPGKRIMGMSVVSCDNVVDLGDGKVIVIPAGDVGFVNALVRSVIKNFTLAFFFPACFTVFFFQHNRAAYDILAKTIVVQNPRQRRH